ncbi:MAG: hypothetical protein K8R77_14990 [Anaerolineaceae bacterium]|nr:hypothetical protein [Anaerolineaceae bacterium]
MFAPCAPGEDESALFGQDVFIGLHFKVDLDPRTNSAGSAQQNIYICQVEMQFIFGGDWGGLFRVHAVGAQSSSSSSASSGGMPSVPGPYS